MTSYSDSDVPIHPQGKGAQPVYLDHHSTTPVHPKVLEVMLPWMSEQPGNAASKLHLHGQRAMVAVEKAREQVAGLVEADPDWVIFTSGATEAINLALQGFVRAHPKNLSIVTCATEHPAVLETLDYLRSTGSDVHIVTPDIDGQIPPRTWEQSCTQANLISLMHTNNEIGTIHDVESIANVVSQRGAVFHLDAAQSAGKIPIRLKSWGINLCSISGHKFNGPKGIGALIVKPGTRLKPLQFGGGHERGLRPGTLNVAAIAGLGVACEVASQEMDENHRRVKTLKDRLLADLLAIPGAALNGGTESRLYNNINISFEGILGELLAVRLKPFVSVSTGSACSSSRQTPSHVLQAIGLSPERIHSSIRIGLGPTTTTDDIEFAISAFRYVIKTLTTDY